jgi:hypothetical protein
MQVTAEEQQTRKFKDICWLIYFVFPVVSANNDNNSDAGCIDIISKFSLFSSC